LFSPLMIVACTAPFADTSPSMSISPGIEASLDLYRWWPCWRSYGSPTRLACRRNPDDGHAGTIMPIDDPKQATIEAYIRDTLEGLEYLPPMSRGQLREYLRQDRSLRDVETGIEIERRYFENNQEREG